MRTGRDGGEVRVIGGVNGIDEGLELGCVFGLDFPEVNEVYRDIVFFHLLGKLDKCLFIFGNRRADEYDDALALGLILAMF